VVTENKTLLAAHGAELRRIARRCGATLRVEASAIAGVPFLGTHARRPLAACVDRITAILNGTSNYIVSRVAAGATFAAALAEAQARGYAEPDPTNDVAGIDAAEKLAVILGELDVAALAAPEIERTRLDQIGPGDLALAAALGGTVRPVAHAQLADGAVSAFVGPAFVAGTHRLARIDGVENAIELHGPAIGTLFYTGPGAGPDVTAATILDDIFEIASQPTLPRGADAADGLPPVSTVTPGTAWFVRLAFPVREPAPPWVFEFLSGYGLWVRRSAQYDGTLGLLVFPCQRERITAALDALREATGIHAAFCRALEE
jgi:homoserine dehydrogenase